MSVSLNTLNDKLRNLLLEEEPCYDETKSLKDDENFPTTRVLLVDKDPNPSLVIKNFREQFPYQDLSQSSKEGSKNVEDSVEQNTKDQLGDKPSYKKRRMSWTPELHHKFELAVEYLTGLGKVYPKHILKYMQEEMNVKVEGLTRSNVASHLQKYRLFNAEKKINVHQDFGSLKTHQRFLSRL